MSDLDVDTTIGSRVSMFDVEDVEDMPKVRDMVVAPVGTADVQEFARRYHYTETGGNMTWRWGLWDGPVLHGVVAYNLPTRTACESVFGADYGPNHVWHMGRLILSDESPRNSESRLIGWSLREIRRDYPHVWAVLTYAATDANHIGYVYQATNALYTGVGGESWYYVDKQGRRHGTHHGGHRVHPDRAAAMGWSRVEGGVKHRYVYILGSKSQRRQRTALLRFPVLPYPKKIGEDAAACKQTTSSPPDSTTEGGATNGRAYSGLPPVPAVSALRGQHRRGGIMEEVVSEEPEPQQPDSRHLDYGHRHVGP